MSRYLALTNRWVCSKPEFDPKGRCVPNREGCMSHPCKVIGPAVPQNKSELPLIHPHPRRLKAFLAREDLADALPAQMHEVMSTALHPKDE